MPITRTCCISGKEFTITDEDLAFYDKISPVIGGERFLIPPPTLCPEERLRRRLAWRNAYRDLCNIRFLSFLRRQESSPIMKSIFCFSSISGFCRAPYNIYHSSCSIGNNPIVSMYSPDRGYLSVEQKIWWNDKVDNIQPSNQYNFSETFSSQFHTLIRKSFLACLSNEYLSNENSEYVNGTNNVKDCYLIFSASSGENCEYCEGLNNSNNCFDCYFTRNSENCYECISLDRCYDCQYLEESRDCRSCFNSYHLEGCHDCFLCINLTNQQYCIQNQEYPDEASYREALGKFLDKTGAFKKEVRKQFDVIKQSPGTIQKMILSSENVIGNHITNSHNVYEGYDINDTENSKYVQWLYGNVRDCYDCYSYGNGLERSYECGANGGDSSDLISCYTVWKNSHKVYYSFFCYQCEDCFGCVGLKNKQYCVFNKQYSKEEYTIVVRKIIDNMIRDGEWGEFFSPQISPFGYNETMANLYFPLEKEKAIKLGYQWNDYEPPRPEAEKYIPASRLPENIEEIPDDILSWAIECEESGKYYKITKPELEFYRKHHLPIPRKHYDMRRKERFERRFR